MPASGPIQRHTVHIGVIGVHNLSSLIPAVVVHVDPEWIAVRPKLVDKPSVVIDGEVDPTVRALDIRVEAQKPRGMRGGSEGGAPPLVFLGGKH